MKKSTYIVIMLLLCSFTAFGQVYSFMNTDSLVLTLNYQDNDFDIVYYGQKPIPKKHQKLLCGGGEELGYLFAGGRWKKKGKQIICYDSLYGRYYRFEQIDVYTLVTTNCTSFTTKGEIFKLDGWDNDNYCWGDTSWKGSKRDGMWEYQVLSLSHTDNHTDSVFTYIEEYNNDTLIHKYLRKKRIRNRDTIYPAEPLIELPIDFKFPEKCNPVITPN